jgi:hypothetical protein
MFLIKWGSQKENVLPEECVKHYLGQLIKWRGKPKTQQLLIQKLNIP